MGSQRVRQEHTDTYDVTLYCFHFFSFNDCILKFKSNNLLDKYFGHLMQRTDSLEKTLMLGKIEGGRKRE